MIDIKATLEKAKAELAAKNETKVDEKEKESLETLATAFRKEEKNPLPEIIKDATPEEKAQAMAEAKAKQTQHLPTGYYAKFAGSIFGKRGLIKLKKTPGGMYQSKEEAESTGTIKSWETLIARGQAKLKK